MKTKTSILALTKAFFILLVMCCFISCTSQNEKDLIKWVKSAKKPIRCKLYGSNALGQSKYTLFDADNNVYSSGLIEMSLPDTLK